MTVALVTAIPFWCGLVYVDLGCFVGGAQFQEPLGLVHGTAVTPQIQDQLRGLYQKPNEWILIMHSGRGWGVLGASHWAGWGHLLPPSCKVGVAKR